MPEEKFSDLAVIATHYSERFEVEVDEICQQAFVKAHPRRLFQASLFEKERKIKQTKISFMSSLGESPALKRHIYGSVCSVVGEFCLDSPLIRQTRIAEKTCIIIEKSSLSQQETTDSERLVEKGIIFT